MNNTNKVSTMMRAQVSIPEGAAPGQYFPLLFQFVHHVHKMEREHSYNIITEDNKRVWMLCLKYGCLN